MEFLQYRELAKTESEFSISADWGQGRSIFGGLTAALLLVHIESNVDLTGRDLRTVNIHFCGATLADTTCEFRHRVLSAGRSVIQVEGQLLQNGEVKTEIIACFTTQRVSAIDVVAPAKQFPVAVQDTSEMSFEFKKDSAPFFVSYFDLRQTNNNFPFSGSNISLITGWMRFAKPSEALNDATILALIDAWPPAILPMMTTRAPSSTITWNVEFMHPRANLEVEDLLYYECSAIESGQGYAHTEGKIYHPNGQLLALNRQMVGVYDKVT
ncbi:MAG: thioesterase family protein [Porticoccaceae bacterium]|jgi:acyl-CoA thioesterase|nr:thioesterase family protein [Porticoccaceae bacterium]